MSSSNGSIPASRSGAGSGGYSAVVRLFLRVNGERLSVAQVGGGRLYFDKPVSVPAGPAEIIIEIDGEPESKPVRLVTCSEPTRVVVYSAAE